MRVITAIGLGLTVSLATPVGAGDPKPFPEFTFKRVKVPTSNSGNRIKVQILPSEEPVQDVAAAATAPATREDSFDWYWQAISPALADTGPGRLQSAVLQLDKGPGVSAPRLQTLRDIVAMHGPDILTSTIGTNVSPALVLAVISIESSGRPQAVSSAGATGLMQLMPATASRFGVSDATDPGQNIKGGVAYLDWLINEFKADPILVLASYNAGEGAVRGHKGVPPFAETRAYVPKVLAAWKVARGLCLTPPELISDGCAFDMRGS